MEKAKDDLSRTCFTAVACAALSLVAACGSVTSAGGVDDPTSGGSSNALASSTLIPGVVADSTRRSVYIMRPAGGIESIDIDTGEVEWMSTHADQPLFVADGILAVRVAANAESLVVASLDPATGEPAANTAPQTLPLPSGVVAGIDDSLPYTFRHSVTQPERDIVLAWEFVERDVSGIAPPGGSAYLRRETGAFRYLDGKFEATQPPPKSPSTDHWPDELKELFGSQRILRPPWETAGLLAIAQQYYSPDRLVLRRWRRHDGEPLSDINLFDGRALAVLAASDERHIVVSVPSGRPTREPRYLLRYVSLDSGELLAELNSRRSAAPFCVQGSRLLHVSQPSARREQGKLIELPLELVATDLASGDEVWRHALRDTAYRGTAPPR